MMRKFGFQSRHHRHRSSISPHLVVGFCQIKNFKKFSKKLKIWARERKGSVIYPHVIVSRARQTRPRQLWPAHHPPRKSRSLEGILVISQRPVLIYFYFKMSQRDLEAVSHLIIPTHDPAKVSPTASAPR